MKETCADLESSKIKAENHVAQVLGILADGWIPPLGLTVPDNRGSKLDQLKQEELSLEKMRAMVSPTLWPRVYTILQRIRARIRQAEKEIDSTSNQESI